MSLSGLNSLAQGFAQQLNQNDVSDRADEELDLRKQELEDRLKNTEMQRAIEQQKIDDWKQQRAINDIVGKSMQGIGQTTTTDIPTIVEGGQQYAISPDAAAAYNNPENRTYNPANIPEESRSPEDKAAIAAGQTAVTAAPRDDVSTGSMQTKSTKTYADALSQAQSALAAKGLGAESMKIEGARREFLKEGGGEIYGIMKAAEKNGASEETVKSQLLDTFNKFGNLKVSDIKHVNTKSGDVVYTKEDGTEGYANMYALANKYISPKDLSSIEYHSSASRRQDALADATVDLKEKQGRLAVAKAEGVSTARSDKESAAFNKRLDTWIKDDKDNRLVSFSDTSKARIRNLAANLYHSDPNMTFEAATENSLKIAKSAQEAIIKAKKDDNIVMPEDAAYRIATAQWLKANQPKPPVKNNANAPAAAATPAPAAPAAPATAAAEPAAHAPKQNQEGEDMTPYVGLLSRPRYKYIESQIRAGTASNKEKIEYAQMTSEAMRTKRMWAERAAAQGE